MKKVGQTYPVVFSYDNVKRDINGWVDATKYIPADYDLVSLRRKIGKSTSGWAVGMNWEGLRLKEDDEILFWKKKVEKDPA